MSMTYYFISDLHIGGDEALEVCDYEEELIEFLGNLAAQEKNAELVIIGDIFGMWEFTEIEGPEKLWTRQRRNACPSQLIESLTNAFRTTAPKVRVKAKTLNEALEAQGFSIEIPTGGAEVAAE